MTRRNVLVLGTLLLALTAYGISRGVLNEMAARTLFVFVVAVGFWATEALPLFATSFVVIGLEILLLASNGGFADTLTRMLVWLNLPAPRARRLPISATAF